MSKEILLKKLNIKNFKGIKNQEISFSSITNIYGENGIGKTTIPDSFTFLLFDKDSKDSSKFDVQPLDDKNNPIHNLETVIEALMEIDGQQITIKKVYKEKYSKIRGTAITEFKGYESKYYINEVPKKANEYKTFVNELLEENLFKLITNPIYFSTLPWKERREIITEIVGDLDAETIIYSKKELEPLRVHLKVNSIDDFVKANKSKINQLKKDRDQIPSRIDEVNNSIQELDFTGLELQRRGIVGSIKSIDQQIQDKSKTSEQLFELKNLLFKKKSTLSELEYSFKLNSNKPKEKIEENIRSIQCNKRHLEENIRELESKLEESKQYIEKTLVLKRNALLKSYNDTKNLTFQFDEENCKCPMCNRKFEVDDVEKKKDELEKKFNSEKADKLEKNIKEGKKVANEKATITLEIDELIKRIENKKNMLAATEKSLVALNEKLRDFKTENIEETQEIKNIKSEIESLNIKINNFKAEDVSELKNKKNYLQEQLQDLEKQLAYKSINQKSKDRIDELRVKENKISELIAELEGLEILSEEFIRTKIEMLEDKVNSKFKYVKFKMFRNQVNGGLEECCEPCVNGVPFTSNLNTAAKINAGLDIINTLCSHYGVNAPIFIDNRESTNKIIPVESQIINLIVSNDKTLKVEVV